MHLDLVIVAVDELAPAVEFWRSFTGWSVAEDVSGVYAELRTSRGARFGLYATEHFAGNLNVGVPELAGAGVQRTEIYLKVDDTRVHMARAVELGASVLAELSDKPWGERVGYLRAPGGFVLAIAESLDTTSRHP